MPILISDIVEYRFGGRDERKIDEIEAVVSYLVKIMDEVWNSEIENMEYDNFTTFHWIKFYTISILEKQIWIHDL